MRKFLCALVILAACAGCSSETEGSVAAEVKMTDDFMYEPDPLTISVGETATWINDSSQSHTVTAYEEKLPEGADFFASGGATSEEQARSDLEDGLIDEGETFEVTFNEPGTYTYFCIPHESQGMIATVVVEE